MTLEKIELNLLEKDELQEVYEKIRPMLRVNGSLYNLRSMSQYELTYLPFIDFRWPDVSDKVDEATLEEVVTIEMYHPFTIWCKFIPKVNEILSQIPFELRDTVCAFEIVWYPELLHDLVEQQEVVKQKMHKSKVKLYKKKA